MTTLAAGLTVIVTDVWSTVVALPLDRYAGTPAQTQDPPPPMLTCVMRFEGAWTGAVAVSCPSALAERIAESMLQISHPNPTEVGDALGEVANMIAGNAKSLLPQPSAILLPVVTPGGDHPDGMPVVARLAFACEGLVFTVTALGAARDQEPA